MHAILSLFPLNCSSKNISEKILDQLLILPHRCFVVCVCYLSRVSPCAVHFHLTCNAGCRRAVYLVY